MKVKQNHIAKPNSSSRHWFPLLLPVLVFTIVVAQSVAWAALSENIYMEGTARVRPLPLIKIDTPTHPENYNFSIFRGETDFTPNDMQARLIATDPEDGDITSSIYIEECKKGGQVVTCPTAWLDWEYGDYTITYRATNSQGLLSLPLIINIEIWQFINIQNGTFHGIALTSHGQAWSWGWNSDGQRGIGAPYSNMQNHRAPTLIPQSDFGGLPVTDVAAAHHTSCAINIAGAAYCWGLGSSGERGDGTTIGIALSPVAVIMPQGITFQQISGPKGTNTSGSFGALGSDGNVYTWGSGAGRGLGTGNSYSHTTPVRITNTGDIVYVWQGNHGGAAVTDTGQVYVWGRNNRGQLGRGDTAENDANSLPGLVPGLSGVSRVSYGGYGGNGGHVLALKTNGEVWGWGWAYGVNGQNNNQTTPLQVANISNARFVNAGADFSHFVVGNDVYGIGYSDAGEIFGGNNTSKATPTISPMENIAGNVGTTTGGYNNAYIMDKNGVTLWGVGYSDAAGQQFGSTEVQNSSVSVAIPWTFTAAVVEW